MKTKTRDLSTCLKRRLWIVGVCLTTFSFLSVSVAYAVSDNQTVQQQKKGMVIKGKVLGTDGEPIIGASVLVKGSTTGVVTDLDGNYTLSNVSKGAILEFSYVGYVKLTKTVGNETTINAILYEDSQMLEGVEVVAFGTQKKESVIGAISTVKVAELKTPSSNLTNALAGRIAGVISYQRTGEPGVDDASFFVRGVTTFGYKKDPLILIAGIELTSTDLARLQPDDIASFSIMKDATATALYGARGANGVILVKTKEGQKGKARLSLRVENSISTPTQEIELADPVTYMRLHNEAYLTRNPLAPLMYSEEKIDNTVPGAGSVIYPATDWRKELLKDFTMNQRVNLNITGGGDVARYYVAASYSQDNGILEVDKNSNFNNNIKQRVYTLRSNVNINATKTTELIVRLSGVFDDYNGPLYGGSAMYNLIMKSNPVLFPAKYPKDEAHAYTKHTLFGNAENGQYLNPYAEMVRGYKESGRSNLSAQFEVKQDLKFLTEGLSARLLFNTSRISSYDVSRKLNPYYYKMTNYDYLTGDYAIDIINPDDGSEYLIYDPGGKSITANMYIEAALNYNRDFGKHGVGGLLVYQLRNNLQPNAGSLQASLPYRNVGLSGRFTYAYNNRYFAEFNFGYNGSERFHKSKRFGFFPSAGLAWVVSNESFWDPFKDVVSKLKLRASYGIVGNDAIGSGRFLYLSDINMNDSKYGANFGYNYDYHRDGISVKRYSDPEITWEKSAKTNFALEFTLFNDLNVTTEYYTERRKSILQQRTSIPASMGLWVQPYANLGEAKGHGVDLSLDYNKYFANKSWLQLRGNFTYATSEYMVYEDYEYPGAWWKQKVGYPTNQTWGYIAEGLFVDDNEVANSPVQFGEYGAGDIKYRDVNKDGKITDLDQVPIGYPKEPEIVYGFGASYGYKNWDISVFFQGLARESFWIDYNNVSPFFNTVDTKVVGNRVGHNALAKFIADSHWSEDNRDAYAVWPRLSPTSIENNSKTSTWFMRDGSFLRLKQLEIGYTIPEKVTNKVGIKNLRFYVTGNNLLCFSKFKLWDPEMAGSGLGYPVQRVYNIGLNLTF